MIGLFQAEWFSFIVVTIGVFIDVHWRIFTPPPQSGGSEDTNNFGPLLEHKCRSKTSVRLR